MDDINFEWDDAKDLTNQLKHGISFKGAQNAFYDHKRIIVRDIAHDKNEKRYFCMGKVNGNIMTVRFTYRQKRIRIYGAGYWRKGKNIYEQENKIH